MYVFFFFQAEDGIRDLVRSRGLGDVYKRQALHPALETMSRDELAALQLQRLRTVLHNAFANVPLSLIHI